MHGDLTFATAIVIGLLGSTHCIGMCGGIVGALNMGIRSDLAENRKSILAFQFAYNTGRISSYILVGASAGFIGRALTQLGVSTGPLPGELFAATFMVALGLYLTNWWRGLALLEKIGFMFWQHIRPWGQRLFPIQGLHQALLLGMVWGWLPCGLVYAAVAWSLTTADPVQGAILMFGFGLGTLPSMLITGTSVSYYTNWVKARSVRTAAGVFIIGIGLYSGYSSFQPGHHHHHFDESSRNDQQTRILLT